MYGRRTASRRAKNRLHVELLEARLPMAADTFLVNFQLAGAPLPLVIWRTWVKFSVTAV